MKVRCPQSSLIAQRSLRTQLHLTPEQLELVPTVVPAQLRLLTATREGA